MSFVTVEQGAILEKRVEAVESSLRDSKANADEVTKQLLSGIQQLEETRGKFNEAVATEIQNCKSEAETMRNDVKEEVLNMKGVLNTDSNATKTEIAKLSANMAKEIEEMKTIITQVSTEGTVNFANMVAQHQQGHGHGP